MISPSLVKSEMPNIRQYRNSCGIASVLMAVKPNKNKKLNDFFEKLDKKLSKSLKIDKERFDFPDRVQFWASWLLLHELFGKNTVMLKHDSEFPDLQDVKSLVISKLDEMVVFQKTDGNAKILKDVDRLYEDGTLTLNLLESYLEEHKTDVELKTLAKVFGLIFQPQEIEVGVDAEEGRTPGAISNLAPGRIEEYMKKLDILVNMVQNGAVLANYEFHWLALREILAYTPDPEAAGAKAEEGDETETTPHIFKFNNPLSSSISQVTSPDLLKRYHFYCFELDLALQDRFLGELREELKL